MHANNFFAPVSPPHAFRRLQRLGLLTLTLGASAPTLSFGAADAQLFVEAQQAASGACFPKYHLELWDTNVPREWSDRTSLSSGTEPICEAGSDYWSRLRTYFRTSHAGVTNGNLEWTPPQLAVTLEGGGSKSAPFSLGALAGLEASGLLSDVDVISTVSGGTYAAYFYFSRLLDAHLAIKAPAVHNPNEWFKDCIPSAYHDRFSSTIVPTVKFCSEAKADQDDIAEFAKAYPYQAHVRFYQDLVHWKGGLERVNESRADTASTYANVANLLLQSLATVPLHTVMNTVFSMPESSSPSRFAYRAGIERAYAHTLHSWQGASAGVEEPTGGEFGARVYRRAFTMRDLRGVVGTDPCQSYGARCKAPLWIANATASSGRDLSTWISVPSTDALRANFEMSPFGQGSGTYGFLNEPVSIPLRDVVGSSAAFFDRDQREFGLGPMRLAIGAGISFLNLEWGSDVANFNVSASAPSFAHITPFPLYHVPAERQRFSPTIHLSDGGNTDNLGVLAALRRGASNILIIAATGDGTGKMKSLCRAKNHLELDGIYRVEFPQLAELNDVCSDQIGDREVVSWGVPAITRLVCERRKNVESCAFAEGKWQWKQGAMTGKGYDMWDWPIPVLSGKVVRDESDGSSERVISRLYLVKPAIDQRRAIVQLNHEHSGSSPDRLCDLDYAYKANRCVTSSVRDFAGKSIPQQVAMPCSALAFAAGNACVPNANHGTFPQHDVVFTTLNSSYTLFGAYYDLARHITSQINWSPDRKSLVVPTSTTHKMHPQIGAKRPPIAALK